MASGRATRAGQAYIELSLRNRLAQGIKGAQSDLKKLGQRSASIGKMVGGVGIAMATPFAYAALKVASFDDAMRSVGAITQASAKDLAMLTDTAKELGRTTSFTAVDVASLMTELGRAGFDPSQINDMTGAVLNLSRATGTDATLSAGILAASIRQYGLDASDASRVTDSLTAAANKSFNSVESLGEALSYAGPVAADFGMSMEETLAILGTLGNVGIQGSQAGTAIRRLLTLSGAEAEKLQKTFGVAFVDAAGNARPLVDALGDVSEATKDLGTAERAAKFNEGFGLLGITAASAIGKTAVSTRELLTEIEASGGIAAKTAEEMDAGLGGSFRKIQSATEGALIAIGEGFSPALQSVVDQLTGSVGSVTEWIEENHGLVVALAGTSVALVGTGAALVGVGIAAQLGAAGIGMLLSPIVLSTVAVSGLGYAFVKYTSIGAEALDWLTTRFGPLVETAQGAVSAIGEAIKAGDLETAWELTTQLLELIWLDMTDELRDAWADAMDYVLDAGASTTEQVGKLFQALAGTLKTIFDQYKSVYDSIYNYNESELTKGINSFYGIETIGEPAKPKGSAFEQQYGGANNTLNSTIAGIREFGSALEAEAAGQRKDRTADRDAARKERQERIDALRASLNTSADESQKSAATAKAEATKPDPKPDGKPDLEAMLKANGYQRTSNLGDVGSIETPNTKSGETGTFSSFAAGIIGQGQSTPQRMLSLTERIAKAVEAKSFRQQGKADREQARDARLQAKAEENRRKFGNPDLSPANALDALFAGAEQNAEPSPSDALASLFSESDQNAISNAGDEASQAKAAETKAAIMQSRRDVGIGEVENATSPVDALAVGTERMNKALEAIEQHTGTAARLLKRNNVARFA